MKKIAVLLTVLTVFSLIFSACTASPSGEETTAEETTLAPANGTEETPNIMVAIPILSPVKEPGPILHAKASISFNVSPENSFSTSTNGKSI